ncbi:MAG: hypothetical protein K2P17_02505 [Helicobacteraceae bacterium]|nr:hypothetical protein [Helicobacteraceae bacterium]
MKYTIQTGSRNGYNLHLSMITVGCSPTLSINIIKKIGGESVVFDNHKQYIK